MAFIAIKLIREINILLSFLSFIKKVNFSYSQKKRLIYTLESIVSENDQESIVSENGQESIVSENQAAIMARRLLVCFSDIVNSPTILRFWDSFMFEEKKILT